MNYAIRTENLTKRFGNQAAIDGLDLQVPDGAIYALIGPNGAGKTTTLKVLMNIFPATRGRAEVLGTESTRLRPREFEQIGYVSENQEMPGWMTVKYFLDYLKPFYAGWDQARIEELLRQFDLPLNTKLANLSRGMRVKAALASSLAYRPRLLVLDEPFSGLDALVRDELIGALLESADGTAVLISSHDLSEIESFASHVGFLDRGRLQFSEDMTSLTRRFRAIEITLQHAPSLPTDSPSSWLGLETSAGVVRFVETDYDQDRTPAKVRSLFGDVQVSINAMSLREIFVVLAMAGRKAA
ncbi:MAG TPA: ABC transporter ATP-binding protein [Pyrinomonadaceae bacterium]|nr:ABC transporter ATP-binding protein [Pyrinomonadaceae bacterium]